MRLFLDKYVNVGNGNKDFYSPVSGRASATGKLVEILRIIVVDGAPEQVSEIARRVLGSHSRFVNSVELGDPPRGENSGTSPLSNIA